MHMRKIDKKKSGKEINNLFYHFFRREVSGIKYNFKAFYKLRLTKNEKYFPGPKRRFNFISISVTFLLIGFIMFFIKEPETFQQQFIRYYTTYEIDSKIFNKIEILKKILDSLAGKENTK